LARPHGPAGTPGLTLFDHADELAMEVPTSCRRTGRCHECIVEVRRGMAALSPPTAAESFLRGSYRLACQAWIADPTVDIDFTPLRRKPKILTHTADSEPMPIDPAVTREGEVVLYAGAPIDRYRGRLLGLAVDLGTTTVVAELVDLESGAVVESASFENPQRFGGSDVMHRISYDGAHRGELQRSAAAALNRAIRAMVPRLGTSHRTLYEIVVAGNPTMRDILFRLEVQDIGQRPYKSLIERAWRCGEREGTALNEPARALGLVAHPAARVYGLPLIASHVGADTAACLLAAGMLDATDRPTMLLDIGTNTEVAVAWRGRITVASCPAGPAFEGGLVTYGMPGYEGAIESLTLGPDGRIRSYRTIGDLPPQGLCGSGLIDLLAELRRHGVMTEMGVFLGDRRLREIALLPEHGITFSRTDASNLAQAKAANVCGQLIVLRAAGLAPAAIERLYLAGGFANFIDVRNAIAIGFLAPVAEERVVKIGNAAVHGARAVLVSLTRRRALEESVRTMQHVELETTPDFFDVFVEGCQFKPMPTTLRSAAAIA